MTRSKLQEAVKKLKEDPKNRVERNRRYDVFRDSGKGEKHLAAVIYPDEKKVFLMREYSREEIARKEFPELVELYGWENIHGC